MLGFSSDLKCFAVSTVYCPLKLSRWPVMGGPTAHPTGVTLASSDPPKSLNAPGGSLDCFLLREAREPGLEEGREWFLWLVGATSAVGGSERGSDRQSGPLHRIKSSGEVSYPAVGVVAESMVPLPRNLDTIDGQVGKGAAAR